MPNSDEFFGVKDDEKSRGALPPGMFPDMAAPFGSEPTPEDMEKAADAVRYSKITKVKEFHVGTYDLSRPDDLAAYKTDYVAMYVAIATKTGVLAHMEKKLLVIEGKPRMVVHMEWYEYQLEVTDHMMKERRGRKGRDAAKI